MMTLRVTNGCPALCASVPRTLDAAPRMSVVVESGSGAEARAPPARRRRTFSCPTSAARPWLSAPPIYQVIACAIDDAPRARLAVVLASYPHPVRDGASVPAVDEVTARQRLVDNRSSLRRCVGGPCPSLAALRGRSPRARGVRYTAARSLR
jgi:hypothetical protein